MKRWSTKTKEMAENPKIDLFLAEILEVCKKHKFSLSHEDIHGAFKVIEFNKRFNKWLLAAADDVNN